MAYLKFYYTFWEVAHENLPPWPHLTQQPPTADSPATYIKIWGKTSGHWRCFVLDTD